jgi:ankyrin repeat protein
VGASDAIPQLVAAGAHIDAKCHEGETPLHRAARLGWMACVAELLRLRADTTQRNKQFLTALEVAGTFNNSVAKSARAVVRRQILSANPALRTLVLHHPDCALHKTPVYHQESSPGRVCHYVLISSTTCPIAAMIALYL